MYKFTGDTFSSTSGSGETLQSLIVKGLKPGTLCGTEEAQGFGILSLQRGKILPPLSRSLPFTERGQCSLVH